MKINILIVDDSISNLVYVEALLESIYPNYNVVKAHNGKEALQTVAKEKIDLIILDIEMPEMNGFQVAKALKSDESTRDIPVVFLTAHTKLRTKGLEIGAVDYLTKPIDPEQFTSRILLYTRLVKSIKENREKDQKIQEQSKMAQMGEMISMIAHQWRQPLGAISSTSIDLNTKIELETFDLEGAKGREECQTYFSNGLKNIDEFVKNLTTTIDDFRNFYSPNKEADIALVYEIINKALNIIRDSLASDNIETVEKYICYEKAKIYSNEIMQVILNIMKNSQDNFKEKMIKNPRISITCKDAEDKVAVEICDNGGGIPENILPNIFDPYFSTKDEKNGTGLGLYMSKIIIEEHHNGSLLVKNCDDGVCFTIVLDKVML